MSLSLLTTKLYIPPPRPELVPRLRLIERLNGGVNRKLTLVCAPAGFGKTTLLSEWVAQRMSASREGRFARRKDESRKREDETLQAVGLIHPSSREAIPHPLQFAWLSLDEGDNDLVRFLSYLIAALQTIEPDIGQEALQSPPSLAVEESLTQVINQVNAVGGQLVLILDDYHLVTAQPIHDAMTFLLDHLPGNLHLVIASRSDPPLPLPRLRARGQLAELRLADLRFTPDEAATFLLHVMGVELPVDAIAALTSRTEGWIAGLQMAAVSMQGVDDVAGFIRAFTGSNRYVLDYLVEEVLQRQPQAIQAFLLQTSILDRMTGSLCDAVLENGQALVDDGMVRLALPAAARSQAILEYLERANLFIVPLDERREWYRYHRLFADLLQQRLQQSYPGLAPTLQFRASAWCEQNGLVAKAIDYALAAKDFRRAASLVEQAAQATLMRSEVATFLRWMQALPDELVRSYLSLCVFYAWALLMSGHPWAEVLARLQDAAEGSQAVSAQAAALHAFVALFQGKTARAAELSRQALEQLPESDTFLRSFAAFSQAAVCFDRGEAETGRQILDEIFRLGQKTSNIAIGVLALCYLAESHLTQGRLHKAQAIYRQALDRATDPAGQRWPVASMALMGLGELAREWNDFDAATDYLEEGLELGKRWGKMNLLDGYVSLAHLKQAQGDVKGAQHFIRLAQELAAQFDATQIDDWSVAMFQALLWVRQGNLEAAARWVQERQVDGQLELDPQDSDSYINWRLRKYEQLVLARLLIARGRPAEALALLDRAHGPMQQRGRMGRLIEIDALQALAFQAQGELAKAVTALERALSCAEPEGYVRLFADEGEPMKALLQAASQKPVDPSLAAYVGKLLSAFGETPPQPTPPQRPPPQAEILVEPLSEREMQVLRLLPSGLSATEIAEELIVSVSTVRSHIKNIYAKLDVHSRYEAVARARELDLL